MLMDSVYGADSLDSYLLQQLGLCLYYHFPHVTVHSVAFQYTVAYEDVGRTWSVERDAQSRENQVRDLEAWFVELSDFVSEILVAAVVADLCNAGCAAFVVAAVVVSSQLYC
jgi:hypothetical protein